jgi:hypothetical protein
MLHVVQYKTVRGIEEYTNENTTRGRWCAHDSLSTHDTRPWCARAFVRLNWTRGESMAQHMWEYN